MSAEWFGGRLRELRTAAGLTQKELAQRIGITVDGLAKLERGDRKPGWETVVALCDALSVSCDQFREEPGASEERGRGRPRKGPAPDQAGASTAAKDIPPADRKPARHKPRGRKAPRPRGG